MGDTHTDAMIFRMTLRVEGGFGHTHILLIRANPAVSPVMKVPSLGGFLLNVGQAFGYGRVHVFGDAPTWVVSPSTTKKGVRSSPDILAKRETHPFVPNS